MAWYGDLILSELDGLVLISVLGGPRVVSLKRVPQEIRKGDAISQPPVSQRRYLLCHCVTKHTLARASGRYTQRKRYRRIDETRQRDAGHVGSFLASPHTVGSGYQQSPRNDLQTLPDLHTHAVVRDGHLAFVAISGIEI